MRTFVSDLSQKHFPIDERISGDSVRASIMGLIQKDYPGFDASKHLSLEELNYYREKYISDYLSKEMGEMSELDGKVLDAIKDKSVITDGMDEDNSADTFGQRVADKVASFGGSWTFITIFLGFIILWMALNIFWLANKNWDPYPFILLNLMLSCLAALQAPVIMMSNNRQSDKDRARAKNDYMVNLKSELEVRGLHEKIDHLMLYQQQELLEIQKVQIEMLNDIQKHLSKHGETAVKHTEKPVAAKE